MDMAPEEQRNEAELSGEQILERCARIHLAIREYVGQCVVSGQTLSTINGGTPESKLRTSQAHFDFKRDAHFNIHGTMTEGTPFFIESNFAKTMLKCGSEGQESVREKESLGRAVASMTGVAASAPTTIPALLMGTNWGFPFLAGLAPILRGYETLAGHNCFVVSQRCDSPARVRTFWIDSHSFLLRQMRSERGEDTHEQVTARKADLIERGISELDYKILSSKSVHVFSVETVVFGVAER